MEKGESRVRGGPWPEAASQGASSQPAVARDLAFVERGAALSQLVTESAAQRIEADVGPLPAGPINPPKPDPRAGKLDGGGSDSGGCAHCSWTDEDDYLQSTAALGFALIGLCGVLRRRRRSNDG